MHTVKRITVLVFLLGLILVIAPMSVHAAGITYYSQGSLAPHLVTSWNTIRAGGGTAPANFTAGDVFVIQSGHVMSTSSAWNILGTGSKLWIENGGTLSANLVVTLAAATTFQIDAGGTYSHNNTAPFASTIFAGTESFNPASTVVLKMSNTTGPSGIAFGNLTVNYLADPGGSTNLSGAITTINGNLTIQSTSTREFRLTASTSPNLTIGGNLVISGGTLNLTSGTGSPTLNIGGNFSQTGGTFTSTGAGIATLVFTGGSPSATFTQSSGTLTGTNMNWQVASGKILTLNGTLTIASGRTLVNNGTLNVDGTLATASTVTNNGSLNVNGTFQLNQGGWATGTDFAYGANGILLFNNTTGSYGVNSTDVYWSTTNGPANVTVQGAGGMTLNAARTVAGTFQTAASVTNANNLTLGGTAQLNTGGYFSGAPTYGSSSTLKYNTGGVFSRSDEWSATGGAGYPANVQISNNTTLNYPNGSTVARSISGNLTIDSGSALYMDYGSPGMNNPLTVAGDLTLNGSLSLGDAPGGDLYVGGDFTNNGTFYNSGRAVTFNGSGTQNLTANNATTFPYLTVNNGVTLVETVSADNVTVTNLTNSGTIRKTQSVGGTGAFTFGLASAYNGANLAIDVTTVGTLSNLQVDRIDADAPNSNATQQTGRYWEITETGAGFAANLTLPHNVATPSVCKYLGAGNSWSCLADATLANAVTRNNITDFSIWAVGNNAPTASSLLKFTAKLTLKHQVKVKWETGTEAHILHFDVYRQTVGTKKWVKLNANDIVPKNPGGIEGASYSFTDKKVQSGKSYRYRMEIATTKGTEKSETVKVSVP